MCQHKYVEKSTSDINQVKSCIYFRAYRRMYPPCRVLACLTSDHFLPLLPGPATGPSISLIRFCSYSLSIR